MHYISTRGNAPNLGFDDVLLRGLAPDGGLYLPAFWPQFSQDALRTMRGLPYQDVAVSVMFPFVEGVIPKQDFKRLVAKAYENFTHPAIAPMKQVGHNLWLMELFHGPTLAFKDFALQLLGVLFDYILTQKRQRLTIVGATSGDTGSAAIEACRDRENIDIYILHPHQRTSEVQRRQMTTIHSANIFNLAVEGTFDDCQDIVKALFADEAFRHQVNMSAVNSINWARIMAQIVYYFFAALHLGAPDRAVTFSVPTGNFGNVFAAYGAKKMGLPIDHLLVASNSNDILTRFFESGTLQIEGVSPTLSPSMDIQVSSNFERLLFDLMDKNGHKTAAAMASFRQSGTLPLSSQAWQKALTLFSGFSLADDACLAMMKRYARETGEIIEPHSIIGVAAAENKAELQKNPVIAMATAHPAKFPDAVKQAVGMAPTLPAHIADLYDRQERYQVVANDVQAIKKLILAQALNSPSS